MGKASRVLLMVLLSSLLLVASALPAFAAPSTSTITVCWNNCGIGGDTKTY